MHVLVPRSLVSDLLSAAVCWRTSSKHSSWTNPAVKVLMMAFYVVLIQIKMIETVGVKRIDSSTADIRFPVF